ncbi:MAG: polysaccharide pyruvyl transferase family protein [Gammaproteobacteria bacterium]|nr:polysaccharide pyruvyl transferase family protein [Gammaproteobacteria bacterium]
MSHPLILFGAFDRHNLGDLLLAEVAAVEAFPRPMCHAGLVSRDMRPYGGPVVRSLAELLAAGRRRAPIEVLQVGGEVLTTTAWDAWVMVQEQAVADAEIHAHDAEPGREAYARARLGTARPLPYLLGAEALPPGTLRHYRSLGGVEVDELAPELRDYARTALAGATSLSVRDKHSQAALARLGLQPALEPDPVENLPPTARARIEAARDGALLGECRRRFPGGFLAVQFAAQYESDAELALIAAGLAEKALPIVLFRAGAAPWHDDEAPYRRLMARLAQPAWLFPSLNIWEISALIAACSALFATSLHARILARDFGRPLLPLPVGMLSPKLAAYERSWHAT